jgi:crotonobetainyl-CoA:carnitine CoA-transferase CaiB-like acyl-CoA transferase
VTNEARVAHRDELKAVLEARLKTRGKREWTAMFIGAGLPAGPINTLDEVFSDPQVQYCQLVETLDHPTLGALRQVVTPVSGSTASEDGARHTSRHAPPRLGEHTVDVLREAGFDAAQIDALLAAKAVHQLGGYHSLEKASERAAGVTQ